MPETLFRGRRAFSIENQRVRVTVLEGGGHVAEIREQASGVNPLWTPPWPSIDPTTYDVALHPEYGDDAESKLLSGIMGHSLCLDHFGGVSREEAAAGLTVHGEGAVERYAVDCGEDTLTMRAALPEAHLAFERRIQLLPDSGVVDFTETVENLTATDRPVGWTEHVTLGPPFLEKGSTQFHASATRSKVVENDFTKGKGYMKLGAEFKWPYAPRLDRGAADLRTFTDLPASGAYTAHLMDLRRLHGYFTAWSPKSKVAFGYVWWREEFPWLGIWEENYSRKQRPWNGKTLTRGMEFGVSPFPETRRDMLARGSLFGAPGYRWIPARSKVTARYRAAIAPAQAAPLALEWSEKDGARFA